MWWINFLLIIPAIVRYCVWDALSDVFVAYLIIGVHGTKISDICRRTACRLLRKWPVMTSNRNIQLTLAGRNHVCFLIKTAY